MTRQERIEGNLYSFFFDYRMIVPESLSFLDDNKKFQQLR